MTTQHQRWRRFIRDAPRIMARLGAEYLRLREEIAPLMGQTGPAGSEWIIRRAVAIKTRRMEQINILLNYMVRQLARVPYATGLSPRQVIFRQAAAVGRSYQRDRRYQIAHPPQQYNPLHEIHWPHHLR